MADAIHNQTASWEQPHCRHCSAPVVRKPGPGRNPRYCSASCRTKAICEAARCRRAARPKAKRDARHYTCKHCGKVYRPKNTTRRTFCSRECSYAYKSERAAQRKLAASLLGLTDRSCKHCGEAFSTRHSAKVYCSLRCGWLAEYKRKHKRPGRSARCLMCGAGFLAEGKGMGGAKYCTPLCARRAQRKANWLQRRIEERLRLLRVQASGVKIRPAEIFARDGWRCQICGKPVKADAVAPHPRSPTVDHILPLSKGGEHVPSNVQCAHFLCNSRKSDRLGAQRLLFG